MGLDTYLEKRTSTRGFEMKLLKDGVEVDKSTINPSNVVSVVEEVGYWRKANAIHNWFVKHVQNGIDDCGTYSVSKSQLTQLLEAVNNVLDNAVIVKGRIHTGTSFFNGKKEEHYEDGSVINNPDVCDKYLPSKEGFFFGGTDYDQYYLENLKYTKELLEEQLESSDEWADFSYSSSW